MKNALVCFADSTGDYQSKMKRLENSLKGNFTGDFLGFTSYEEIGCESHKKISFKFKPYAIQKAIDLGYENILWADSQVYAKKNIQPVFDYLEKYSYLIFDNIGYSIGDYTNDRTINHFGITRDQSWGIKMVNAKVLGLSSTNLEWFNEYKNLADSLYTGEWTNHFKTESQDMRVRGHRHDQSVLSCVSYKYGMNIIKSQDTFFANEDHRLVMPIADSVCLFAG